MTHENIEIIRTQANGFINDELKYRRLRIEALEEENETLTQLIDNLEIKIGKLEEELFWATKITETNNK
jgi:predicted RNase H-like nuclease (RuvC/YqgF family)